jgi:hypothetical protein
MVVELVVEYLIDLKKNENFGIKKYIIFILRYDKLMIH